jgi:predicted esterase
VWLHPSGAPFNDRVERLAPRLARRGFALLVPTHKQFREWIGSEANQLMTRTLPDAATLSGIDGRRPILMGFSAGAQMALLLWAAAPERFGGLVLSGAAPAFLEEGRVSVRPPPEAAARARTPVLVIAGALDPVASVWERHAQGWSSAGVPLTLEVVPGEAHRLLLDAQALPALLRWLEEHGGGRPPLRAPAEKSVGMPPTGLVASKTNPPKAQPPSP